MINETGGISHFVPDYAKLLKLGTSGIIKEARALSSSDHALSHQDFYQAVETICRGLEDFAAAYQAEARRNLAVETSPARKEELEGLIEICGRVPRLPARTLLEAFQSLIFAQIALNQESLDNSVCPGRLDQVLYPYYRDDLSAGRIDEMRARELVGCFTIKMCEIVPVFSRRITRFFGGMFNGQVVVVGGQDRAGRDATNGLTWLFLDAIDALRMRQPNYNARLHANSPPEYVERVVGMLRDGSVAPALMNDEAVVPMLEARGTVREDALDYSPVGCVEPVPCGVTYGSTDAALANLVLCLERALGTRSGGPVMEAAEACQSMEQFLDRFRIQVDYQIDKLIADLQAIELANANFHPTPLTSTLIAGCLESGKDASAGGARYNYSGIQGVGIVDIANSMMAMEEVLFNRRLCGMTTLLAALRKNFEGFESLRGHLLRAVKYGNDVPAVDQYANRCMEIFSQSLERHRSTRGGPYYAGFYSVTSHKAFGAAVGALPSGRSAGQPLANGLSPTDGQDRLGPTAAMNSVAGLDLCGLARNGISVNLKIDPHSLGGGEGLEALCGLVRGYFAQKGMQVQMNVLDPAILLEARDNPDSHPWLLVRVSGYSAYFNDLSPEMKQEIIDRSLHSG